MAMRIGELAHTTGTTPRALRHYEEAGLIASRRRPNGYRDYDPTMAVRVHNIRFLLDAGLTLEDIGTFGSCLDQDVSEASAAPELLQVAWDRLAVLDRRIAAQVAVRDRLATALRAAGHQTVG
jgi:DNA-binding transcriptional MerR regulator